MENKNISGLIEKTLPDEIVTLIQTVATISARRKQELYLVGGIVRDLLLGLPNFDLDFVVENDAIALTKEIVKSIGGKLTTHIRFNTAKLNMDKVSLDFATARSEAYAHPGALPTVKAGSIKDDMYRRDFTINAMAVNLIPGHYGELIDLYGGYDDLNDKSIRILHNKSFIDDATRIWRAIRYEQRLGFQVEPTTLRLIKRDINMLDTVSSDRIRHELELILKEKQPEKMLHRAWVLKALRKIHSSLKGDIWLQDKFRKARTTGIKGNELSGLYLALMTYRLTDSEIEEVIDFLHPARQTSVILRDSNQLKTSVAELSGKGLTPAYIYSLLDGYHYAALIANQIICSSASARSAINLYLEKLQFIKTDLNGADLESMGVMPGPRMQEILMLLHNARLNGEVSNRQEEEALVKEWLQG